MLTSPKPWLRETRATKSGKNQGRQPGGGLPCSALARDRTEMLTPCPEPQTVGPPAHRNEGRLVGGALSFSLVRAGRRRRSPPAGEHSHPLRRLHLNPGGGVKKLARLTTRDVRIFLDGLRAACPIRPSPPRGSTSSPPRGGQQRRRDRNLAEAVPAGGRLPPQPAARHPRHRDQARPRRPRLRPRHPVAARLAAALGHGLPPAQLHLGRGRRARGRRRDRTNPRGRAVCPPPSADAFDAAPMPRKVLIADR